MVIIHWLLYNGVGQNITASALLAVPTIAVGWHKLMPRIREHERKVHELHQQLMQHDRLNRVHGRDLHEELRKRLG